MKHPKKMYFLIVKIVIPGQYLGPNRGSKFNIEICRENLKYLQQLIVFSRFTGIKEQKSSPLFHKYS